MVELFKRCLNAEYIHTENRTDYVVEVEDDIIYIFFEWSDDLNDWRLNLNFPAKAYKHSGALWFVHRGFLSAWKDVRGDVEMQVGEILALYPKINKIRCVGYSHGAAVALLCTEDMEYLYGDKLDVQGFGFGCPRTVWGFAPRTVKARLARFTAVRNKGDIVTHVPPAVLGYRHFGLIKIGKRGKYDPITAHTDKAYKKELKCYKYYERRKR